MCIIDKETSLLPEKYEAELETYLKRVVAAAYSDPARRRINQLCYHGTQPVLCLGGATTGEQPATVAWIAPWSPDTLTRLVNNSDKSGRKYDQTDADFLHRTKHLATSILLFLSQVPIEYTPAVIVRGKRHEGRHLIPALHRARFVGSCQVRPISVKRVRQTDHEPSGLYRAAHLTCGHWKRTVCGQHYSQRKLVWISSYRTSDHKETTKYATVE
jgi:hypothetical protein